MFNCFKYNSNSYCHLLNSNCFLVHALYIGADSAVIRMLVFASVRSVAIKTHNNDITLNTICPYNVCHLWDRRDHCGAQEDARGEK